MRRLLVLVLVVVLSAVVASAASLSVDGGVIQGFQVNVDLEPSTTAAQVVVTSTIPSAG